jgi:FMN phosphatase YigB (HAD superfamily)
VVSSEQARAYKPHPRPFRMALHRLGLEPDEAVHVGDDPGEDRAGARAAGLEARLVGEEGLAAVVDEFVG